MNQSITVNFGRYIQDFLTGYLPLEKNASQNTISSYRDTFKLLLVFMDTKKGIKPTKASMSDITKENLISFLKWLEDERKCSIRTRNQRLAAICSFLNYTQYNIPDCLFEIQKIQSMPTKKALHREISYLTPENLKILLSQPDNTSTKGLRDCAILTLMYDGGLRVQELIELKWEDLRLSKTPYTVCVVGKGKKRRTIPLSDLTGNLLKTYKEKGCSTKNVFVNYEC